MNGFFLSLLCMALLGLSSPVLADGGGGGGLVSANVSPGFGDSATTAGSDGTRVGGTQNGASGGSAGVTGGAGGDSGTVGGAGGATPGADGTSAADSGDGGGGGGGGGAHGATITAVTVETGAVTGGNGGNGGNGRNGSGAGFVTYGAGGGGGAGGWGVVIDGSNLNYALDAGGVIQGGDGGAGGTGSFISISTAAGGSGGTGGTGVAFTGSGQLVNEGSINGGTGGIAGSGGDAGSTHGSGGTGITGSDLTILNSGSISGGLSGDGSTRANAIEFTGGTNTLTLNTGGTITGNIDVTGSLTFDQTDDATLSEIITGSGSVTKAGTGTLILTGNNTYTGTTSVNGSLLTVNGSIANSATTVNSGGTLGGSGTVGDLTLNGGTLAPGNSIGTLNVTGDLSFGSGVYEVEVDAAGNSDLIIATGNADLSGARVSVLPEAGSYADETDYTILQAGSVSNTFTGVSVDDANFAFLDASLSYSATDVILSLVRNDINYGDVARTRNQQAVGGALQTLYEGSASSGMNDLLGEINILSSSAARNAYDQLSGVGLSNSQLLARQSQQRFGRLLNSRGWQRSHNSGMQSAGLATRSLQFASLGTPAGVWGATDAPLHQRSQYWLTPVYGEGDVDGDGNASGMDYHYAGLSMGFDQKLNADWLLGAALSYTQSDARFEAGSTDMDGVEAALYSRWNKDALYLQSYGGLGWYGSDSERHINVGGSQTAESDYDTTAFFSGIEGGHSFEVNQQMLLTPYVGLDYAYSDRESFTESGAGAANLDVDSESIESIQSTAGVRLERFFNSGKEASMAWYLKAAWLHEFADTKARTQAGFINNNFASFSVDGPELDRNRLLLGAGIAMALGERSTVSFAYDGEFSGTGQEQHISATYRYQW